MKIGETEKSLFSVLTYDSATSTSEMAAKTPYNYDTIENALSHLIDMSYIHSTPDWDYILTKQGKQKKQDLVS